jgi:hypothetical protein
MNTGYLFLTLCVPSIMFHFIFFLPKINAYFFQINHFFQTNHFFTLKRFGDCLRHLEEVLDCFYNIKKRQALIDSLDMAQAMPKSFGFKK